MAIHDGVVWSRAAATAVARGNCLGGTFGGNCLENAPPSRKASAGKRMPNENLCGSWQLTQRTANGGKLCLAYSHRPPPAPHSAMNRVRIKRAFSLGAVGCKEKCGFLR